MRVEGIIFCLGTLGLLGSCKSQEIYNKTLKKQHELINKENVIIAQNSTSVLEPNGHLSSIMGDDVVYFLSKEDSTAFDNQIKLAHGIVPDVQAKKEKELTAITNEYNNNIRSANNYYNSLQNKPQSFSKKIDLEIYHSGEIKNLKEQNAYLTRAVNLEYGKEMKRAKRIQSSILSKACKMPGVTIVKGGARRLVRSALR